MCKSWAIGEYPAPAAFVRVDEGGPTGPSPAHVVIECVLSEIRLTSEEPSESREIPLEHPVPSVEPREALRGPSPEALWILGRLAQDPPHSGIDQIHVAHSSRLPAVLTLRGELDREGRKV